jgi:SAM-dependent methyltransferase
MLCPLCKSDLTNEYCKSDEVLFLHCDNCGLVFKHSNFFPSLEYEKKRYLLHQNDVEDKKYQKFVSPIVEIIKKQKSPKSKGLDFGAGPGPVITKLLCDNGYSVSLYDPFFYPDKSVLTTSYDFIICCEVMEHFRHPSSEFKLLRKLLKPKGTLYCMTQLIPKETAFENWYYQRDPTHLVFYSVQNIDWIKKQFGFSRVIIDNRLIIFET